MPKSNKSEYALLSLLYKKDMAGYDIKNLVNKVAAYHWSESNAQIYPLLNKIERLGFVSSYIDEKSGARLRRIYSITEKGLNHLKQWVMEPVKPAAYREEFLIKLSAAEIIEPQDLLSHFQHYKIECERQLNEISKIQKDFQLRYMGKRLMYLKMVYNFSELNLQSKIQWCEENIKVIPTIDIKY